MIMILNQKGDIMISRQYRSVSQSVCDEDARQQAGNNNGHQRVNHSMHRPSGSSMALFFTTLVALTQPFYPLLLFTETMLVELVPMPFACK